MIKRKQVNKHCEKRTYKNYIIPIILSVLILSIIGIYASVTISNNANSYMSADNVTVNNTGVYYNKDKLTETADLVICRGSNDLDDLIKSFDCDVVCKSTDIDCTGKIQTAINSLSQTGGKIYFKTGNGGDCIPISDTLVISNNGVVLEGSNLGGFPKSLPAHSSCFVATKNFSSTHNMINISGLRSGIRNMWFNGNSTAFNGIVFHSAAAGTFLDFVQTSNMSNDGILSTSGTSSEGWLNNVWSNHNGNNGVEIVSTDFRIYSLVTFDNNGSGLMLNPGSGSLISDFHPYGDDYELFFNGTYDTSVINSFFDSPKSGQVMFNSSGGNVGRISIIGNNFYHTNGTGGYTHLTFSNANGKSIDTITISGNIFDDTAAVFNYTGSNITNIKYYGNVKKTENYGNIPPGVDLDSYSVGTSSSENLILYYNCDDNVNDYSGNGNNGTFASAVYLSGVFGNACNFSGSTFIDLGSPKILNQTGAITVSAWVYPDVVSGTQFIYGRGQWNTGFTFGIYSNVLETEFSAGNGTFITFRGLTTLSPRRWQFVSTSWDNVTGTVTTYVNGEYDSSVLFNPTGFMAGNNANYIGKSTGGSNFKGRIDELLIYNRVLTNSEIRSIYNKNKEFISNQAYPLLRNKTINGDGNSIACLDMNGLLYRGNDTGCPAP